MNRAGHQIPALVIRTPSDRWRGDMDSELTVRVVLNNATVAPCAERSLSNLEART